MSNLQVRKMVISAMFLALGLVLPFLTGQIPQIGSALLPMHIPVLLCGFVCGWQWGTAVGFIAPLLRSVIFGMPPMFPVAAAMAFELCTYGLVAGALYAKMPRSMAYIFTVLISAMVCGRVVWGLAQTVLMMASKGAFTFAAFISGAVTTAIPGIILQLALIPIIVYSLERAKLIPLNNKPA